MFQFDIYMYFELFFFNKYFFLTDFMDSILLSQQLTIYILAPSGAENLSPAMYIMTYRGVVNKSDFFSCI